MNLSQDEINAMMAGLGDDDTAGGGTDAPEMQEEESSPDFDISAFLTPADDGGDDMAIGDGGFSEFAFGEEGYNAQEAPKNSADDENSQFNADGSLSRGEYDLNATEVDTLGEVGNICMGAVATTMYTLLDKRVSITTPRVSLHTTQEVLTMYQVPFVVVEVEYIEGIDGKNLLLLKEPDAALITDLLMGGDGHVEEPIVLTELHMSAISEIMNQMIGASATALSKIINRPVNISPPVSNRVDVNSDVGNMLGDKEMVIKISFEMEIEGLLQSQLLQLVPFSVGLELVEKVTASYSMDEPIELNNLESAVTGTPGQQTVYIEPEQQPLPQEQAYPQQTVPLQQAPSQQALQQPGYEQSYQQPPYPPQQGYNQPYPPQPGYGQPYPPQPGYGQPYQQPPYPPQDYNPYSQQSQLEPRGLVDVSPMQFQSFDSDIGAAAGQSGMNLVYDIPLQVSVELGRTKKQISEILEFGHGTVVVLDKLAGEPVEVMVNGKLIARGEVVVIDENYGVRITEIFNTSIKI